MYLYFVVGGIVEDCFRLLVHWLIVFVYDDQFSSCRFHKLQNIVDICTIEHEAHGNLRIVTDTVTELHSSTNCSQLQFFRYFK